MHPVAERGGDTMAVDRSDPQGVGGAKPVPDALRRLRAAGQSIWLDTISREILRSGELARLVRLGLGGVTSNPTIFEKAIAVGDAYPEVPGLLASGLDPEAVFEQVAVADIRDAADQLRPTFDARAGSDGFVSLEVSPRLANDTAGTIAAARRIWLAVDRPNLMIKIPATIAGIPAIADTVANGINVNVTLLFNVERYVAVANAYLDGLERFRQSGGDLARVSTVASFFVSRVDTAVDGRLAGIPGTAHLIGKSAIANARIAYAHYRNIASTPRWQALADHGARPMRLLWASTSVKNPALHPTYYVDALIGPDTVNTVPAPTLDAIFAGVDVARSIDAPGEIVQAETLLQEVMSHGIDLDALTDRLELDGVASFEASYTAIIEALTARRA